MPSPELDLKVINLWAGPGAGKSTTAAGLFNLMKNKGCCVELVTEYAKELTYEKNSLLLQNQLHVLAEQDRRLRRLAGQVEWAITDSPLPLGLVYRGMEFSKLVDLPSVNAYRQYQNYDYFIHRTKAYQPYGRNQTEAQARALDDEIRGLYNWAADNPRCTVNGEPDAPFIILGDIKRGDKPNRAQEG